MKAKRAESMAQVACLLNVEALSSTPGTAKKKKNLSEEGRIHSSEE
jgi:hypothetical protein